MTSKSIRRATAEDVPVLTQIRNDVHANKVAHGDYAWGKEGEGVSALNRRFVRLDCAVQNAKLCAYYESLDFIRVGLKPDGYVWSLYEKSADELSIRTPIRPRMLPRIHPSPAPPQPPATIPV